MKLCPKCNKQFSDDANFCPVDAARLGPILSSTGGGDSLTTRFELGETLGGRRTGSVHKAIDKQTSAPVVVKIIAPRVLALPGVAQRLERELKQLERVQSAGVARVIASGKRDDDTWVALELLDGAQTLADAITARGPIALDQAAHLVEVIGEALIEAAQVGVVHRDLAPKNVLFAGNEIKMINFSLPVPTTEKIPGVPEFVAPEQVDGKPVDQRSNLYSLGALYYYVLTGQTVHAGSADEVHRAHSSEPIKTPSSLATVPGAVEAVIMRALDRSPTKRFLTVRQFVDEVGRIARGEEKADSRSPQALGKGGGRPKADLVQTLLGVRAGFPLTAPAPAPAPAPQPVTTLPMAAALPPASHAVTVAGIPPGVAIAAAAEPALMAPAMGAPVAIATSLPAPSIAAGAPTAVPPPERSPWAPPSTIPPSSGGSTAGAQAAVAVAVAAPEVAKVAAVTAPPSVVAAPTLPVPAAPVAPVVATTKPPVVSNAPAPAGKKKSAEEAGSKGKFRETLWFKKGELDAVAAAAAETADEKKEAPPSDKGDSLPLDERYKDDGTITRGDKEKYSLRSGNTAMIKAVTPGRESGSGTRVSEDALIGEMKGGRQWILIAIGAGVLLLVILIVVLAAT
ncbi:MAG: serine/threonine-protein kinase [Kofleriaceae bacterium]